MDRADLFKGTLGVGCWLDASDESTHVIDPDGSRWAMCKLGSLTRMGPLTRDGKGRWCQEIDTTDIPPADAARRG